MGGFIARLMRRSIATPESIAQKIIKTMDHKDPSLRVPVTADAVVSTFVRRILPRNLYHRLLYRNLPGIHHWVEQSGDTDPASSSEEVADRQPAANYVAHSYY